MTHARLNAYCGALALAFAKRELDERAAAEAPTPADNFHLRARAEDMVLARVRGSVLDTDFLDARLRARKVRR